jgi:hypothetical protein
LLAGLAWLKGGILLSFIILLYIAESKRMIIL